MNSPIKILVKDVGQYEIYKCGGCNNETSTVYSFETNDIDKEGICADCFMEMLIDLECMVIRE